MIEVKEYLDGSGKSPFADWFNRLNPQAGAKVSTALYRLQQGNFSSVKGVGSGVYEFRIHYWPGYRIYFGKQGAEVVILVAGGTKRRQHVDIAAAKAAWRLYQGQSINQR